MKVRSARRTRFSSLDLFCGCGGLSLGLRRAGFKVLAAIDNDELSVETYRKNHKRTKVIERDIRSVCTEDLMKRLKLKPGDLDLMAGCPPCQGFSKLRTFNGAKKVNEPMNDLVFEFVRFVRAFLPKTVMMENVPALMDDYRFEQLGIALQLLGYRFHAKVLDAARYGVPQRRLRLILLGSRRDIPSFATPVRAKRTVSQAIRRLPAPDESADCAHNYSVRRSAHVLSLIRCIPRDGGSRSSLSSEQQLNCHREFDGFKDVYGRMAWREPAPTITGGCINPSKGRFIHPSEDRAVTLREAALLQGFPSSYEFDVSKGRYAIAQLIGNAFPPKFAQHHAGSLYRHIETHFPAATL